MFQTIEPAAPDAILGLTEAFRNDPNPGKINLAVGVYKDQEGRTPILDAVKRAERHLLDTEASKSYLPIDGDPAYATHVQSLLLGANHPIISGKRAVTAQTPGGTGALRVAGDYLKQNHPDATLWLSDPTWANHPAIFEAAGVMTRRYAYFDSAANAVNEEAMLEALGDVSAGDVVLMHGCCHNPTGADPDAALWERVARLLADRGALPLVDFAYQGFGDGLEEDAAGLRTLAAHCPEMLVCSSFSKNFGLYNERVGALTVVAGSADAAAAVHSRVKQAIRRNYSNPPAHGAAIVEAILDDPERRELWVQELAGMRTRINTMRRLFADSLDQRGIKLGPHGNTFITRQRGMFSFSGLDAQQVRALRENHGIYIVGSGRINVAGMTQDNLPSLCDAIAEVMVA